VTSSEKSIEGFELRWTSNPIERSTSKVSKRCKGQWIGLGYED